MAIRLLFSHTKETPMNKKTIKVQFADLCRHTTKLIRPILSARYNLDFCDNPDFVFFSVFGQSHKKYKNCVKIFVTGENILPNFNECDYGTGFDYMDFGTRYFRKTYTVPPREINDRTGVTPDMVRRKFCNFIYSNTSMGAGAILRQQFCQALMQYRHVDCPGRVLHNLDTDALNARGDEDWAASKQRFLENYKFTIAFENSSSNGYTTEKLIQPLLAKSVPIYWGNPMVVREFNPRAFINCNDYNNDFDRIIERIRELDNDDEQYLAMLRETPMQPDFDFDQDEKFAQWIYDIIERGNTPFNKDPLLFQIPYGKSGNFLLRRDTHRTHEKIYICGIRVAKRKLK